VFSLVRRMLRVTLRDRVRERDERLGRLRREPEHARPAPHVRQRKVERLEGREQLLQPVLAVAEREQDRDVRRNPRLVNEVVAGSQ